MRTAVVLALALTLAPALAGCTLVKEPEVRELAGPTDGYTPTAAFLKVHVKRDDGSLALLDFDRRDWYASKIAELVDKKQVKFVQAQAMPRDVLNEYVAQSVVEPSEIAALRYDAMGANAEQRKQMDAEYQALLEAYLETAPVKPTELIPLDPIP